MCFFATLIGLGLYGNYVIKNRPVEYAIGRITNYSVGHGASSFHYKFSLNNIENTGVDFLTDNLVRVSTDSLETYIAKKYFIKFNEDNPSISRLMLDKPVWDSS